MHLSTPPRRSRRVRHIKVAPALQEPCKPGRRSAPDNQRIRVQGASGRQPGVGCRHGGRSRSEHDDAVAAGRKADVHLVAVTGDQEGCGPRRAEAQLHRGDAAGGRVKGVEGCGQADAGGFACVDAVADDEAEGLRYGGGGGDGDGRGGYCLGGECGD